jgi:PAS domain S-box-containing protein
MDLKNNLYEILFGAIQEGLILVNDKGVIVELNKTGNFMFGYTGDELVGQKIEVLVPTSARGGHEQHRSNYNAHPTARSMGSALKLDGVRKDGSEFPVQVSLNPFENKNGQKYVVALVSDVTERRENEQNLLKLRESLEQKVKERTQELRESERLYKSIARNFPSGVISIFDSSFKYLFAEGQGLYELGIETSDLIGLDYLDRIDPRAKKQVKEELDEVFKGESKNFEVKVGERTYSINAVPLSDEGNEVDKILVVEKNITAQKEVSKKLEETLNKERELTEMKSRFVSMASHEFRTPLSTINSSASLIKKYHERESFDKIVKHADRIKNSVRNLTAILNDFLSFEKLEANKVNVNFDDCSLPQLLLESFDEMVDMTKPEQNIIYKGPKELIIPTDGQLLKNTMLNMLSNAVKYSRAKGEIIVSLEETPDNIVISIQDFGLGIPLADQKNLFTRFFRAGNVTNIEGTGLGLNIVLRYLDLLKGEISFKSKEGEGTIFFITLPKQN